MVGVMNHQGHQSNKSTNFTIYRDVPDIALQIATGDLKLSTPTSLLSMRVLVDQWQQRRRHVFLSRGVEMDAISHHHAFTSRRLVIRRGIDYPDLTSL